MLYAVFRYPENGYPYQGQRALDAGLVVGKRYPVEGINMGQSYTSVSITGYGIHNSILFDFENEDGSKCDIYRDPRYSPYT